MGTAEEEGSPFGLNVGRDWRAAMTTASRRRKIECVIKCEGRRRRRSGERANEQRISLHTRARPARTESNRVSANRSVENFLPITFSHQPTQKKRPWKNCDSSLLILSLWILEICFSSPEIQTRLLIPRPRRKLPPVWKRDSSMTLSSDLGESSERGARDTTQARPEHRGEEAKRQNFLFPFR